MFTMSSTLASSSEPPLNLQHAFLLARDARAAFLGAMTNQSASSSTSPLPYTPSPPLWSASQSEPASPRWTKQSPLNRHLKLLPTTMSVSSASTVDAEPTKLARMSGLTASIESSIFTGVDPALTTSLVSQSSSVPPRAAGRSTARPRQPPASIVATSEPAKGAMADWLGFNRGVDHHMAKLLKVAISYGMEQNLTERERLDSLRAVRDAKAEQLADVRGELALQTARAERANADGGALAQRASDLELQFGEAVYAGEQLDCDCEQYAMMHERLHERRPHLARKLHFMRSSLIELTVRLHVAEEALDVAEASRDHAERSLDETRRRVKAEKADYAERRQKMMAELQEASIDSSGNLQLGGTMNRDRLAFLKEEQELQRQKAEAEARRVMEASLKKGTDQYWDRSNKLEQQGQQASVVTSLALDANDRKSKQMRQAWQKIEMVTSCDHIKGVLEYWEEQATLRETLEQAEDERAQRKDDTVRRLNAVHDEIALQRDTGYAARLAYDQMVEETDVKLAEKELGARRAKRRCERLEELTKHAFASLGRMAALLTSAGVLDGTAAATRRQLVGKHREIEHAASLLASAEAAAAADASAEGGGRTAAAASLPAPGTAPHPPATLKACPGMPSKALKLLGTTEMEVILAEPEAGAAGAARAAEPPRRAKLPPPPKSAAPAKQPAAAEQPAAAAGAEEATFADQPVALRELPKAIYEILFPEAEEEEGGVMGASRRARGGAGSSAHGNGGAGGSVRGGGAASGAASGDGDDTTVGLSDVRAAQGTLLCTTTEAAMDVLTAALAAQHGTSLDDVAFAAFALEPEKAEATAAALVHNLRLPLAAPMRKAGVLPKEPLEPRELVRLGSWAAEADASGFSTPRRRRGSLSSSTPFFGSDAPTSKVGLLPPSTQNRDVVAQYEKAARHAAAAEVTAAHVAASRAQEAIELLQTARDAEVTPVQAVWLRSLAAAAGPLPPPRARDATTSETAADSAGAEAAFGEEDKSYYLSHREAAKVREFKALKEHAKALGLPPPEFVKSTKQRMMEQLRREERERERRSIEVPAEAPVATEAVELPAVPSPQPPPKPRTAPGRPRKGAAARTSPTRTSRGSVERASTSRGSQTARPTTVHARREPGGPVPRGTVSARGIGRA